jgi:hypothetical protein
MVEHLRRVVQRSYRSAHGHFIHRPPFPLIRHDCLFLRRNHVQHRTLKAIQETARVTPLQSPRSRRRARLEHWAKLLMQDPPQRLESLRRVEFLSADQRTYLRGDDTPLSIAFADPALRERGLDSDCLGEAISFFSLSPHEAHYLLCDCHYEGTMTAGRVAQRIDRVARCFTFNDLKWAVEVALRRLARGSGAAGIPASR